MSGFQSVRHVTSAANPLVKLARQLATRRRARYRERLFLIEGERPLRTALEHGASIHTLIVDEERRTDFDPAFFAYSSEHADTVISVTHQLFMSFSDAEHPQPVMAIAVMPNTMLPAISTSVVALDAIRDPGNMGTIIRTARAAGVDGIALLPGCVDPYNPKVVRASAGLLCAIPIGPAASVSEVAESCFDTNHPPLVVAADTSGTVHYRDVHWEESIILVVGNEASGLSATTRRQTDQLVRIPMAAGVESLNASVATAVLLYAMVDRRSRHID